MALINCPECGKEISDSTKKCPYCGYKLPNDSLFIPSLGNTLLGLSVIGTIVTLLLVLINTSSWEEVIVGFVCLGLAFISLIGATLSPLKNKAILISILTILADFAIIIYYIFWLLTKTSHGYDAEGMSNFVIYGCLGCIPVFLMLLMINKKIAKSSKIKYGAIGTVGMLVMMIVGITLKSPSVGGSLNNIYAADTTKVSRLKQEAMVVNEKPQPKKDYWIGTHEYQQVENGSGDKVLIITINEDKTATAVMKGEKEKTFYGHWDKYGGYRDEPTYIKLHFDDTQVYVPRYGNHGGGYTDELVVWTSWSEYLDMSNAVLRDDYLYENMSYAESKNPNKRVKVAKTSNQ